MIPPQMVHTHATFSCVGKVNTQCMTNMHRMFAHFHAHTHTHIHTDIHKHACTHVSNNACMLAHTHTHTQNALHVWNR